MGGWYVATMYLDRHGHFPGVFFNNTVSTLVRAASWLL